jgi:hypothetical protein
MVKLLLRCDGCVTTRLELVQYQGQLKPWSNIGFGLRKES